MVSLSRLVGGLTCVRLALAVVSAFILEAVGIPTLASQSYKSDVLELVILPVVWIAAFTAVLSSVIKAMDKIESLLSEPFCSVCTHAMFVQF